MNDRFQLHHTPGLGVEALDRIGDGINFLNVLALKQGNERTCTAARDEKTHGATEMVLHGGKQIPCCLRLTCVMAFIAFPTNPTIVIDHHGFDSRRSDIEPNAVLTCKRRPVAHNFFLQSSAPA